MLICLNFLFRFIYVFYATVFLKLLHKATKNVSISQIANIKIHHLLKLKFNKTDISYDRLWKSVMYTGRKKHVGSKNDLFLIVFLLKLWKLKKNIAVNFHFPFGVFLRI